MLHTFPSAPEIVAVVRDWLRDDLVPSADPDLSFRARVAANLLTTLERELGDTSDDEVRFARGLQELGVANETELAMRVREHEIGPDPAVLEFLRETTSARLRVSNPAHLVSQSVDDDPRTAARRP